MTVLKIHICNTPMSPKNLYILKTLVLRLIISLHVCHDLYWKIFKDTFKRMNTVTSRMFVYLHFQLVLIDRWHYLVTFSATYF